MLTVRLLNNTQQQPVQLLDGKSKSAFDLLHVETLFRDSQRRIIYRPFPYAGPEGGGGSAAVFPAKDEERREAFIVRARVVAR